ncbi:MAG: C69 family dipeptidase [bacterium]
MGFIKFFAAAMLGFILIFNNSDSCTNYLITKGASVDGSTMITYNADAGGFMEPLRFHPPADYKEGDSLEIYDWDSGKYLGKIKQVLHTYSVIGNMNEHQVSIGETTFGGRPELQDTTAIMDYGSLMYIALQRAKTAREAIKVMTDLVAEYGYCSHGESFSIADPNECWILDMLGKGAEEKGAVWAARRIPDGYVAAHANQARIREILVNDPDNCLYSKDAMTFAKKKGWWNPDSAKFSFADTYAPLDPGALLFCENRVWRFFSRIAPSQNFDTAYWRAVKGVEPYPLYIKPDKRVSVADVISLMRDHFEGTPWDMTKGLAAGPFGCPVRWKGLTWKIEGDTINDYAWERPVSTQQTAFAFVSQMRSFLPNEIGGCFWYGVDDNYTNVYMPLYCSMTRTPASYSFGSIKEFSFESAFWVFNLVANLAYTKYSFMLKDIQPIQQELENKFFAVQPAIEQAAATLYKTDKKLAVDFLTNYSVNEAEGVVDRWQELWKSLVVKYNDGYINDVNVNNGRSPKSSFYGTEYLKQVIKEKPGYYEMKWQEK